MTNDRPQAVPFRQNRSLLNASYELSNMLTEIVRFNGYKLDTGNAVKVVSASELPRPSITKQLPTIAGLPYKALEAKMRFNHLFNNRFKENSCHYIDEAYTVMEVNVDNPHNITLRPIFVMPEPTAPLDKREFPVVLAVDRDGILVASDGAGTFYILQAPKQNDEEYKLLGIARGKVSSANSSGICLMTGRTDVIDSSQRVLRLLTYRVVKNMDIPSTSSSEKKGATFYIDFLEININVNEINSLMTDANTPPHEFEINVVTTVKGTGAPSFYELEPPSEGGGFVLGGSDRYEHLAAIQTFMSTESQQQHPHFQLQQTDNTNTTSTTPTSTATKPYKYSWVQTKSDVTVYISLSFDITKQDITCLFTPTSLKLRIKSTESPISIDEKLFDKIDTSESLWTLERQRTLTLYLQKKHEGTRWSHLYEDDDHVPETLDPNELVEIGESLEKYTGPESSTGSSGVGVGGDSDGMEMQASTEPTESEDFEGNQAVFTRFARTGNVTAVNMCAGMDWLGTGLQSPVEPELKDASLQLGSVCLKSDVDGIVCSVSSGAKLEHFATFDAFGFVQVSKRDKRFVTFTRDVKHAIVVDSKRYLYIYERSLPGADTANQYMVDLDIDTSELAMPRGGDLVGFQQVGPNWLAVLREDCIVIAALS
ncbi:hypothetical protein HDU76_000993 [Blyttiomyces sp. JEL0837]|nr:hypothetical protein HDU76_000993 [Blyttiomyces sp. JEL0837]